MNEITHGPVHWFMMANPGRALVVLPLKIFATEFHVLALELIGRVVWMAIFGTPISVGPVLGLSATGGSTSES